MVINTNLQAQVSATHLMQSSNRLSQSLARLSSGSKITSPADDSAGQAVAMHMQSKLARLGAAISNLGNATSLLQTKDSYLERVGSALNRMGELAMMAQDVTKTDADRTLYQQEFSALGGLIGNIAKKDFNGVSLFASPNRYVTTDSELGSTIQTQNRFTLIDVNLLSATYTTAAGDSISTAASAAATLGDLRSAMNTLAQDRAVVGLDLEVLSFHHDQLMELQGTLSAAKSRITDVDVAQESTNYAKFNILVQSGTAMLAQANSLPQSVLKLLG